MGLFAVFFVPASACLSGDLVYDSKYGQSFPVKTKAFFYRRPSAVPGLFHRLGSRFISRKKVITSLPN
jgi:hypothetical protein